MLYTKVMIAVFTLMALFACIKPSHSTNLIRVLASAAPPPTARPEFDSGASFRRSSYYTTQIWCWLPPLPPSAAPPSTAYLNLIIYTTFRKFWLYIAYEKFWRLMIIDNWNFIKKVVCNVAKSWKPYKSRVCRGCKWCCKSGFWRAQKICNRKS